MPCLSDTHSSSASCPELAHNTHSATSDSPAVCDCRAHGHARDTLPLYNATDPRKGWLLGWRVVLMGSWLNILMIFIPISYFMDITNPKSRALVFIFSVLSLVPLVKFHDVSTRELAIRIGGSKTGLVNASLSNIVEIVVAISALRKCELRVVQSSCNDWIDAMQTLCVLRQIVSSTYAAKPVLVLGLCVFAGGVRFSEQGFDPTATQMHSSLLSLSVGAVLLPAAYHFTLRDDWHIASQLQTQNILSMSHGVSLVLLFIYGAGLSGFHDDLFYQANSARQRSVSQSSASSSPVRLSPPRNIYFASRAAYSASEITLTASDQQMKNGNDSGSAGIQMSRNATLGRSLSNNESSSSAFLLEKQENTSYQGGGAGEERTPQLSLFLIIISLTVVTVAVAVTADRLVESMDSIATTIPKPYVALIILPAVSSIAECITAMTVSVKDDLNFAISVAVGSTIQTALFVIPLMVTLAWTMGKPLALLFDPFESLVLYISVQVMTYVMGEGRSNWLTGLTLLGLYMIIAVSFWFYPAWSLSSSLAVCSAT
ncbi:hypothetical protein C8R47DRAFT_1213521 [Mycena vitilis]|nr:hypothetical protein C8R47DRAFT_1213521 [Mycena vitilis]